MRQTRLGCHHRTTGGIVAVVDGEQATGDAHPSDYFSGAADGISWAIPNGDGWLAAHVALGLALVVAGGAGLVLAVKCRRRGPLIAAAIGLAAIVGAAFNGVSFLNYNKDFSSMIMAACFALALASYTVGLYQLGLATPAVRQHEHAQ